MRLKKAKGRMYRLDGGKTNRYFAVVTASYKDEEEEFTTKTYTTKENAKRRANKMAAKFGWKIEWENECGM